MNIVIANRIVEISEAKTRFHKIKNIASNWKAVIIVSILALTLKTAAEQLVMLLR
jgi:hypothetical protein